MNNLKKYAGLLNDIAPEGEFLAYINEDEAEMLKDNGALGLLTPQGIPSYIGGSYSAGGGGRYQGGSGAPGSAESSRSTTTNSGNSGGGGGGRSYAVTNTAAQKKQRLAQEQAAKNKAAQQKAIRDKEARQAQIRQQEIQKQKIAEQKRIEEAKRQDDARLDYLTTEYLDVKLSPEQKKEFEQYRTGVRESISPSTKTSNKILSTLLNTTLFPGAGNLYKGYIDATAMGYKLKNPFENIFGGGGEISVDDVNNLRDGDGGGDPGSQLVQNILKIATPNLPDSQVDQYFSNMNMAQGSPLSSDLQTSYDNAKSSVNNILGMTPANQQFGYSAQPYGSLSSTNMADNPFNIPYLQQRGLI